MMNRPWFTLGLPFVMLLFASSYIAIQTPQPSCDTILLKDVFLGGGGVRGGGGPRIPREEIALTITLNRMGVSSIHRNMLYLKSLPDSGHDFIAQVDLNGFNKLCQMAETSSFQSLGSAYGPTSGYDGFEITVTVTSGAQKKSVYERNGRGPAELKAFQQAVKALAEQMIWTPK